MANAPDIKIKRVYEKAEKADGYRLLVDRLWPRGVKKEDAMLDEWDKDIAPSSALRKWFNHREDRFDEFSRHYREELDSKKKKLERLQKIADQKRLTLLYAAKNTQINHAQVLQGVLSHLTKSGAKAK